MVVGRSPPINIMQEDWKEVTGSERELVDIKKTKEFIGVYKEREENVGPNNSIVHIFEKEDGDYSIWGSTVLDARLKQIDFGKLVMIEYKGLKDSEKGGRKYHDYKIYWKDVPFTPLEE